MCVNITNLGFVNTKEDVCTIILMTSVMNLIEMPHCVIKDIQGSVDILEFIRDVNLTLVNFHILIK